MAITLIVQNDAGTVQDTNTYITLEYFLEYHAQRGVDLSEFDDEEDIKAAIVRGYDFMESQWHYKGERQNREQDSAWPRYDVQDRDDYDVYGVPKFAKRAQAEYGLIALQRGTPLNVTPTPNPNGVRIVQESKAISSAVSKSITYANGGAIAQPEYPTPDNIIRSSGTVITNGTIIRG